MIKSLSKLFARQVASPVKLHDSMTCAHCGSRLARAAGGWGERPREPLRESKDGSPGVSPHQPDDWHCPNPDCPPQILKRVTLWASPEGMDICDATMARQFVERGLVHDAAEFYRLKFTEVMALDGMDETRAGKFFDAIHASKSREAWRVLFGLGIPGVGMTEAQVLCKNFSSLDNLFAAGKERISASTGVSESVAMSIANWYGDTVNRKLIARLDKAGVNFKC